ncbi:hypothetical protein BGZ76_001993 [Entomortierella beljakovae]|nr:hypothetical protein BGZ76_001993 [Entomortierella beljakovae]
MNNAQDLGKPGPLPFQGQLTYECFYLIIEYLSTDLSTLHSLLLVNKFFFNATVRHLYKHLPIKKGYEDTIDDSRLQKLLLTVFVSFLQARVLESMNTLVNEETPYQIVIEMLGTFGLELNGSYQPSGISFLQQLYGQSSIYNGIKCDNNHFSPLTIDYSKLFTGFLQEHIKKQNLFRISNLLSCQDDGDKEIQSEIDQSSNGDVQSSNGNNEDIGDDDDNDDGDDSEDDEDDVDYGDDGYVGYFSTLDLAIFDMWIHYNYRYVTALTFDTDAAHLFLPYATKLSALKILHMDRDGTPTDTEVQNTVSFITKNQTTFSWKDPLLILHWDEWDLPKYSTGIIPIEATDYNSYVSALKVHRDDILGHMMPTLAFYEAVRRPSILRVHNIPNFYNLAQNIETDRLIELHDNDHFRYDMGENKSMGNFLQRCSNLRRLELNVEHQESFSWASQHCQLKSGVPLMKLEELEIKTKSACHAAIMAFNNAMEIFPSTLKSVSLVNDYVDQGLRRPNFIENIRTLRSLQLQRFTSSNTIGNFPTLIPNLTHLYICLSFFTSINIGSFTNCPNLEHLEIAFGTSADHKGKNQLLSQTPTSY